jgi:hypothetical protein
MSASGPHKIPGFADAYNEVDARLANLAGLTFALDTSIRQHPALGTADDMAGQAISALVNAIEDQIKAAESFHQVEWEMVKLSAG